MNAKEAHWGEYEDWGNSQEDWGLSATDMDELLFPEPPRTTPPVLYQPSQEETSSFQILPTELCKSDPVVLQTIRLLQHQRTVLQLIGRAQSSQADGISLTACPPPPQDPQVDKPGPKSHYLNFLPPEVTPFTCMKKESQNLEIEASSARLILRKAIATICAHAGFTDTTESVLRVLTDITHEFLSKLTNVLRSNTDAMLATGNTPFHDVVEQTLHDVGMGSMNELHAMYKDRVVGYHTKVRQKTLQLHQQYQILLNSVRETAPIVPKREHKEWWNEDANQSTISSSTITVQEHPATVKHQSEAEIAFNALTGNHQ